MNKGAKKFAGSALSTLTKGTTAKPHPLSHGDFSERIYISDIPIDAIEPNPAQSRIIFNEEKLKELAQSIHEKGVIKPIIVQEIVEGKKYQIIAGERRWRASTIAGRARIPSIVRPKEEGDSLIIGLIENIQRENLTPAEESLAFGKLINEGMTQTEISRATGKGLPHISRCAKISRFLEQYRQQHASLDLTMANGNPVGMESLLQAASLDTFQEGEKLLHGIMKDNLTVTKARELKKAASGNKSTTEPRKKPLVLWLRQLRKVFSTPFAPTLPEKIDKSNIDQELDETINAMSAYLEDLKKIQNTLLGKKAPKSV